MAFRSAKSLRSEPDRDVAVGSVYAALERLEDKGFVTSELGEPTPERGEGRRNIFTSRTWAEEVRETQGSLVKLWQGSPELQGGKS